MSDELTAAFRRTDALANEKIDRGHWTPEQWSDDAERIMGHIDGCASALLNGHVAGLLRTIRALRENAKPRTITTFAELDALPEDSVVMESEEDTFIIRTMRGVFHKFPDGWYVVAGHGPRLDMTFPVTVLYEPLP